MAHAIHKIALPRLNKQQRRSAALCSLYEVAKQFCSKTSRPLLMLDPVESRRMLIKRGKPSKANARDYLVGVFPDLKRYTRGETEWEGRYYDHIFTAITGGLADIGSRSGNVPWKEKTDD
ncbi:MAG: hypothetical protein IPM59_03335 [Chloracidobacterium sp.]|nr:hypothetical protein [Chloracidobacterium sp.]